MHELPVFRLEAFFSEWDPLLKHNIAQSDAETMTIGELLAFGTGEDRDAFERLTLGYPLGWGATELRQAVASTYDAIDWEHTLMFSGAEEAIYLGITEMAGPGDHAIVTVPNYQSMESVTVATGAEVTGVMLDAANDWAFDLDDVRKALRPNTKLIAVNFPNNPTGAVAEQAAFRGLAELCHERGIRLFSDEVYRGLEVEDSRPLPQAADISPSAVSLNVMSKAYGLSGLRIGWVASQDHGILERLERRKHYTTICNAGPSELLATIALKNADAIKARNRAIIAENLPIFREFFVERWGEWFDWSRPQGGCVSFPRYLGPGSCEEFCRALLTEAGVCVLPPSIYASELGRVPSDHFRLGVGHRDPGPALEAFDKFLSRQAPSATGRGVR